MNQWCGVLLHDAGVVDGSGTTSVVGGALLNENDVPPPPPLITTCHACIPVVAVSELLMPLICEYKTDSNTYVGDQSDFLSGTNAPHQI
jgi:hypothetical protein